MSFIRSYVVPEGFPDSVTPSYVPYMTWRALKVYCRTYVQQSAFTAILKNRPKFNVMFTIQHFFGGAMGVFTTRTLLSSVGVSQSKVTPGAIAINWILKVKILYHFKSFPFSCSQYQSVQCIQVNNLTIQSEYPSLTTGLFCTQDISHVIITTYSVLLYHALMLRNHVDVITWLVM